MPDFMTLTLAFAAAVVGMGWLALTIDMNYARVGKRGALTSSGLARLRLLSTIGVTASLALCLSVDHVSMAALVWIMLLAAAALVITFTLAWRAHWLAVLAPRSRRVH